LAEFD